MTLPSDSSQTTAPAPTAPVAEPSVSASSVPPAHSPAQETDAFVKLAMRNMVSKGGKSLFHFGLTLVGLLGVLVGLAYLTR